MRTEKLIRPAELIGCAFLLVVLLSGCAQMAKPEARPPEAGDLKGVERRLEGFGGIEGAGKATVERAHETMDVPFTVSISKDLVVTVEGEPKHFLLPFEGPATLVSTEHSTLVHTSMGSFEVGDEAYPPAATNAILLSVFMGGDGLVLWLERQGCVPGAEVACEDLEIRLRAASERPSIEEWEIRGPDGVTLKAYVDEYVTGPDHLPRTIGGIASPEEVVVRIEYEDIRRVGPRGATGGEAQE